MEKLAPPPGGHTTNALIRMLIALNNTFEPDTWQSFCFYRGKKARVPEM